MERPHFNPVSGSQVKYILHFSSFSNFHAPIKPNVVSQLPFQGKRPPAFKLHIFLTRMHQIGSKYHAIETLESKPRSTKGPRNTCTAWLGR